MFCEKCNFKEATYHSSVSVNGVVTESHLCSECAIGQNKVTNLFNVGNFIKPNFFDIDSMLKRNSVVKNKISGACSFCGKTYADFLETSLLGCANCYKAFESELMPVIRNVQLDLKHVGKTLEVNDSQDEKEKTIKNLEFKLKQAVANENYELASELKKKINELKNYGG